MDLDKSDTPDHVNIILVKFDDFNTTGPFFPSSNKKIIPIFRIEKSGVSNFPLVSSHAITGHKSQGSTFHNKVIIDVKKKNYT